MVSRGFAGLKGWLIKGQTAGLAPTGFLNDHFGEKNYSLKTLEFILWIINGSPLASSGFFSLRLEFSAGKEGKSNCSFQPLNCRP